MNDSRKNVPVAPAPSPSTVSPEAGVDRDPQTGQAKNDASLTGGDPSDLSDGGAQSSRHTGDDDAKS